MSISKIPSLENLTQVGVIGGGNIGSTLVVDLLLHKIPVVLIDVSEKRLQEIETKIFREVMIAPMMSNRLQALQPENARNLLLSSTDINQVKNCDIIIENVPEEWSIKEEVYMNLNRICKESACFGVNTSCMPIEKIANLMDHPDHVVGIHFMNPVYLKDTVEVIRSKFTSNFTLEIIYSLLDRLGKEGILVNDFPGFVSNRISHLFMNEAAWVFQDQVADASSIDRIFKNCFSHDMGPLETADLIGIDTVVKSIDVLYETFQDPKFKCCPLLREMVAEGKLGRKTGQGFYSYQI